MILVSRSGQYCIPFYLWSKQILVQVKLWCWDWCQPSWAVPGWMLRVSPNLRPQWWHFCQGEIPLWWAGNEELPKELCFKIRSDTDLVHGQWEDIPSIHGITNTREKRGIKAEHNRQQEMFSCCLCLTTSVSPVMRSLTLQFGIVSAGNRTNRSNFFTMKP